MRNSISVIWLLPILFFNPGFGQKRISGKYIVTIEWMKNLGNNQNLAFLGRVLKGEMYAMGASQGNLDKTKLATPIFYLNGKY